MSDLKNQFLNELKSNNEICKNQLNFPATHFRTMLAQGFDSVMGLIRSSKNEFSGFTELWQKQRLDLSLEATVLKPKYAHLFTINELQTCYDRLKKVDYICPYQEQRPEEFEKLKFKTLPDNFLLPNNNEPNILVVNDKEEYEGESIERKILSRKRNQEIVKQVKERDNYTCRCKMCNFNYNNKIIQAHHLKPLSEADGEIVVKAEDLITLCPNCHAIAHFLLKEDPKYQDKDTLLAKLWSLRLTT